MASATIVQMNLSTLLADLTQYPIWLLVVCCLVPPCLIFIGYWKGLKVGRRLEADAWANEMQPKIKALRDERDTLYRSATIKTRKLNRLRGTAR